MEKLTELQILEHKLNRLSECRADAAQARETKRKIIEAAQATPEYQLADAQTNEADQYVTALEEYIRVTALNLHEASMEIPSRVSVKQFTVVSIPDESKAKDWCLHNFTPCLKLDTKAFEKAAKDGGIPFELATVSKEARAQIATKL